MPGAKAPSTTRRPHILAAALSLLVASACPAADRADAGEFGVSGPGAMSRPSDLALLLSEETPDSDRLEAARRLVLRNEPETVAALRDVLRSPESALARRAVALAVAAVDPGSPRFAGPLRESILVVTTREGTRAVLAALDTYPARIATEAAVARLASNPAPDVVVREIGASLRAWTGCEECSRSGPQGWIEWWTRARDLDDAAWNSELMTNFRARAERVERRRDEIIARHLDLLNRHYSLLPADRRGELIAGMLRDDLTRVNRLGLELASRTLLNAQPLGPEVALAASLLLSAEDEEIREGSARLLGNLGGAEHADAIARALERENSARVAAPLLQVASRITITPPPETAMLRWMNADEQTSGAALIAMLAHRDLLSADGAAQALDFVRAISPASMTAPQARLLAALGTGREDRDILARITAENASSEARSVAARSLISDPSRVETLLSAAAAHPDVFDAACDAVIRHGATRQRALRLTGVAPRDEASVGRLAGVFVAMAPDQRLATLRSISDALVRGALLAAIVVRPELADDAALLVMHARSRLDALDGAGALAAALGAMRDDEPGASSEAATVRFHALVMLNRLDEAAATRQSESLRTWLDAFERCVALEHAPAIARMIEDRYGEGMPESDRERFRRLVAALPAGPDSPKKGETPEGLESAPTRS